MLAAMRESISRDELARLVADRLDADPELVMRRVAGGRPSEARPPRRGAATKPDEGGPAAAQRLRPPRPLSARERREQALLAMCIASPGEGRELLERLTPEHLSSPAVARARDWLAEHLDDPMRGLPRDDEELVSLVTQLVMSAEREPGAREAMELNFLQLEQTLIEGRIAGRPEGGRGPTGGAPAPPRRARRADRALGDGSQRVANMCSLCRPAGTEGCGRGQGAAGGVAGPGDVAT